MVDCTVKITATFTAYKNLENSNYQMCHKDILYFTKVYKATSRTTEAVIKQSVLR